MSWLAGRSVTTCSRTQPPLRMRVLESEKLHFKLGTVPASVDCWPRLSGFCRSSALLVPPVSSQHSFFFLAGRVLVDQAWKDYT